MSNTIKLDEPQLFNSLKMARKDAKQGKVTHWNSVDELFDTVLSQSNQYYKKLRTHGSEKERRRTYADDATVLYV